MAALKNRFVLAAAGILAAFALLPAAAAAEGTPDISLQKTQPAHALIGSQQEIHLEASNPEGEERGYNLTFRDVLPRGVEYVSGSSPIAPQIVANAPRVGETTLIFENVADLSANSHYTLSFKVEPLPTVFKITELHEYTDHAEAFVNEKPRIKPSFEPNGEPIASSFTGSASDEATTELTAVEITKAEPSPEGEILRGLHEHQTTYTLTVKNNLIGPTSGLEVEDLVPAGLEFLGCGIVDNTTDTKTNPGETEEYPGSGPIDPGNAPKGENEAKECPLHEPYFVATVLNPPGHPAGVYTQVKWKELGSLEPGAELKIQYVAAVPILKNAMTWQDGIEPSAESLGQVANLDNNTGPETVDEEALTNFAEVNGEYEGVEVKDTEQMTRTAEDLAIQKSVTPTEINEGEESTWTFNLESSEYRYVENVSLEDTLPNGLCPLGEKNYEGPEGPEGGFIEEPTAECEAKPGSAPTYEVVGSGEGTQPGNYSSVEEQEVGGTFKIGWDKTGIPALALMAPSEHLIVRFKTMTHTFYQEDFKNQAPVLTGDSWTNQVKTEGADFARCAPENPLCTGAEPQKIFTEEAEGTPDPDASAASQEAAGVTIDKTVRENVGLVPTNCEGPSAEYVQGIEKPLPLYSPGDEICWTLRVDFASRLFAGEPVVSDFIPTDEEYVQGSARPIEPAEGGENTVEATFNEEKAEKEEALEWTLGPAVESGHLVFEWRIKTKVKKVATTEPEDITGNLMKFVYGNTEGETFPLRDRAEVERQEPELSLSKGVTNVGGAIVIGGPKSGVEVGGGQVVTYELDVGNTGNMEAEEAEVWDVLPVGIECADVTESEPPVAECDAATGTLKWTGVKVPVGETTKLHYKVKIPTDVAPGHKFINHSGVTRFKTPTNTGEKFEYIPAENIDPELTESNTKPLLAEAEVHTKAATLKKEATTETSQLGNGEKEATIGEIVKYTVTTTIPANSKVYGTPVLKDELPSNLELLPASVEAELDETPLPSEGATLETLANGAEVNFSGAFPTTPGEAEHTLVLTFEARVRNIAANQRGVTITNSASFEFEDVEEAGPTKLTKSVGTPVVEPHLEAKKKLLPSGRSTTVAPNEVVEYETEVTNSAGASTANEVSVTDAVPTGMEIADPGTGTPTEEGRKIVWSFNTIAPGETKHLTYKLRVDEEATAATSFTNVVDAKTQSLPDVGGVPPAETREASFVEGAFEAAKDGYEAEATNVVRLIGASVEKEVDRGEGTIGTALTYTLHMHLPANIRFFDTTVVDTLPNGVGFDKLVSAECVKGCEGTVEGSELTKREEAAGPTLLGWYFGKFEPGPERELVVVFDAHIEDEKRGGAKVLAGESLTNSVVGLYNETEQGEPAEVPTPGEGNNSFSEETNEDQATTLVVEPHLEIEKLVTGEPALGGGTPPVVQPGTTLTYTLKVHNTGSSAAYDFDVEDDNPGANLTNVVPGATKGPVTTAPSVGEPLVWHVDGPLEAGEELELTYTAELIESEALVTGDTVENLVEIPVYLGLSPTEVETAEVKREYPRVSAAQDLEVELPQLSLNKTSGRPAHGEGEQVDVNEPFPWQIVVKNTAEFAGAKEVAIEDVLPPNWTYVAESATVNGVGTEPTVGVGNPQTLTWTLPKLAAQGEVVVDFEATPGIEAVTEVAPALKVNEAFVRAQDESGAEEGEEGPYEASDTGTAELVEPEFTVEKTPDGGTATAGSEAEYSIKVENVGSGDATEPITVEDELEAGQEYAGPGTLPTGVTQVSVTPPSGTGGQVIVWEIASLGVAETRTIPVPVKVPAAAEAGTEIKDNAKVSSPQAPTVVEDPGSFQIEREIELTITKEADRTNIKGGEKLTYTLTADNLGPSDATGVTVTDEIPAGTTFVNAPDPRCSFAAGEVTCLIGNEAADPEGENPIEFEIEVEVESGRLTPIFNTAEISGNEFDPELGNNRDTIETPIGGLADLAILKTGPSQPVLLGSTFTYKLEVNNEGPSNANGVEVEDELPEEVEFLEAAAPEGTTCTEAGGTLTCELGTLLPKAPTVVIEVTVKAIAIPAEGEPVANLATVGSETEDPETENNESEVETTVLPAADLAITKTAPATVEPNGELTYGLHVENLGPSDAHHVVVSDPLPAGVDLLRASEGCSAAGGVVTCETLPGDELAVNGTADFQIAVHVPFALGGQPLTNTATVRAEEGDPHSENNSSTVTTNVGPAADLSITKTMGKAQAGRPLTYTLAVTNHGPSASSAVTVTDTLPAGTSFKSAAPSQGTCSAAGQTVTCRLGPLAAGGSAQVQVTVDVAVTVTGKLRNSAKVEGPEPDPNKSNNESSVEGPVDPAPPTDPDLRVVKTVNTHKPTVGKPFAYRLAITDLDGADAKNVKVVDTLDGPVKVLSTDPESGHCGAKGSKITCSIPSIPVGKTVHVTYRVVAERAGTLKNTASVQAANGEAVPANNHAVKSVKAKAAAQARYVLRKTASRKVVPGGKKVGFTITLRNGSRALVNAKICDRLPAALVFVKARGAHYVNGEACWQKNFIAAHRVLRLHLIARAVKGFKSRHARNVATARAANGRRRRAAVTVRIKPAFAGAPGGVTG